MDLTEFNDVQAKLTAAVLRRDNLRSDPGPLPPYLLKLHLDQLDEIIAGYHKRLDAMGATAAAPPIAAVAPRRRADKGFIHYARRVLKNPHNFLASLEPDDIVVVDLHTGGNLLATCVATRRVEGEMEVMVQFGGATPCWVSGHRVALYRKHAASALRGDDDIRYNETMEAWRRFNIRRNAQAQQNAIRGMK